MVQNNHFLNTPETLVLDSLQGLCVLNPQLALDADNKIVYIADIDRSKVALVCGGGSGHEPAHGGFVGKGMLSAAVCGNIFASPNPNQVRRGIDLVNNEKGTLIIVKNYTGDILNFGLAKEQYAAVNAQADRVKFLVVGDDVAVGKTQGTIVGRRGLAGTVLVYKIAGALANRGDSLNNVYNVAQWVASRIGTVGVGLDHCHVPGTAAAESHLSASEIEIGMGIHNESGHRRVSPAPPLSELIPQLLELVTSTTDPERSFLPFQGNDSVVLMVNNLGGVSELEMGAIVAETQRALESRGISVKRVLAGAFMTSLNMPGFSLSLFLLPKNSEPEAPSTDLLLSLLDDRCEVPGWKWSSGSPATAIQAIKSSPPPAAAASASAALRRSLKASDPDLFTSSIKKACEALIKAEPEITRMDVIAGDGDCGLTLQAGASAALKRIEDGTITGSNVIGSAITIAEIGEDIMGGTSGALYSIFFSALAQALQSQSGDALTPELWTEALVASLAKLYTYTRARPPSRTLVDPLAAFVGTLSKGSGFVKAVQAASEAAENTKKIQAKAGRSAYVEGDRLKEQNVADPGAWGVKLILENLG
ncbi:dihydroxyacetone kinase [Mycena floridula]|nr:dihydroxyacetone kinase [Mycena floridula]